MSASPTPAEPVFAVVGNPNCGKTTLFNALTGLRQKVGNYPGVTVERKEGFCFSQHGHRLRLIDLPGSYSLQARSPDEQILQDVLLGRRADTPVVNAVLCVADASNLERNLFFATQIIELGLPVILVLNMIDVAQSRGMRIDTERLAAELGVPVVACAAHKDQGLVELKLWMSRTDLAAPTPKITFPALLQEAAADLAPLFRRPGRPCPPGAAEAESRLLLAAEQPASGGGPERTRVALWQARLDRELPGWRSQLIVDRYAFIGTLMRETVRRFNPNRPSRTELFDRYLLHPVWGFVALAAVMGLLFYAIFSVAAPFMDAIDGGIGALGAWAGNQLAEGPLRSLLVDGVIAGVGGVVIFLPQILLLFFCISLLESTGYMARAAFILDRLMGKVGLHGRSFIPLLSSYACAVPGIMATRTIESAKDRLATILVAPFMSCSARLPVYLVIIATIAGGREHPALKAGMLLALYVLGTAGVFAFAWLFKKTLLKGRGTGVVMELPPYKAPRFRQIAIEMLDRAKVFLQRAGTVIFALSIVLWFAMNYPKPPEGLEDRALEYSLAGQLGHAIEPAVAPLGYDWRIGIGVIASFAAREVFVSTLAIVYGVEGGEEDTGSLVQTLQAQTRPDGSPVYDLATCLSILVFFVFALQCVSTVAVVKRETNSWRWPLFMTAYMLATAWVGAFAVYHIVGWLGLA